MEKLELKHIAPYLPYGLKTKYFLSDAIVLNEGQPEDIRDKNLTSDNVNFVLSFCKPILYPLSWLTKEIEHNGKKFMPIAKIISEVHNIYYDKLKAGEDIKSRSNRKVYNIGWEDNWWKIEFGEITSLRYDYVQKLIEWHFNVFNLPEHLYIDKSTIK